MTPGNLSAGPSLDLLSRAWRGSHVTPDVTVAAAAEGGRRSLRPGSVSRPGRPGPLPA
jgi:hypothetical protein